MDQTFPLRFCILQVELMYSLQISWNCSWAIASTTSTLIAQITHYVAHCWIVVSLYIAPLEANHSLELCVSGCFSTQWLCPMADWKSNITWFYCCRDMVIITSSYWLDRQGQRVDKKYLVCWGVSLIAGMEYGMKQWNGKWNGKWNGTVNVHTANLCSWCCPSRLS